MAFFESLQKENKESNGIKAILRDKHRTISELFAGGLKQLSDPFQAMAWAPSTSDVELNGPSRRPLSIVCGGHVHLSIPFRISNVLDPEMQQTVSLNLQLTIIFKLEYNIFKFSLTSMPSMNQC